MPIFDKATGRVVAVIVLLIAIAASLRGYLPGVQRADPQPPHSDASLVYVAVLLGGSLVIVAVALIARLRDPRTVPSSVSPLPKRFSDGSGRPAWRVMLVAAAVLLGWLVLAWLLSRFIGAHPIGQPQSAPPATVSPPTGDAAQRPGSHDNGAEGDVLRYLIAGTVALLVMIVAGAVLARRRQVAAPAVAAPLAGAPPVAAPATSLVRAAESGLAEIEDPDHDPRQAIIACYAAMERALRRHPGAVPQDFDTPTEVLARAVEHHALHVGTATELVSLFEEARFSPHLMTEAHRRRAIDVLQLVLTDMRSPV